MSFAIDIAVEADEWAPFDPEPIVRRAAEATLIDAALSAGEISVVLSDDEHVRELNKHHRGIDKPTNVLSFPAAKSAAPPAETARLLGDIVIAFGTTAREANEEAKSLPDHLSHLVVHGVLHLLGFDHENDADGETMESRERVILARLGIADPYAERGANA